MYHLVIQFALNGNSTLTSIIIDLYGQTHRYKFSMERKGAPSFLNVMSKKKGLQTKRTLLLYFNKKIKSGKIGNAREITKKI